MTDAQKERAAVVAWLRDQAEAIGRVLPDNATVLEAKDALKKIGALFEYVLAIERGDHLANPHLR